MNRSIIYIFPALIDLVVATMQFVCTVRAPKLGASATGTGALVVVWSLFYMPSCYVIGRWVTPKNSSRMLQISCVLLAGLSVGFLMTSSLWVMYLLMAGTGVATALFFVPFQIFMKAVDEGSDKSLAHTTAFYTLAWSSGYALAPLVAGNLMMMGGAAGLAEFSGWKYAYIFSALVSLLAGVGVFLMRRDAAVRSATAVQAGNESSADAVDYEKLPSYAWLAWMVGGIAIVAYSAVRTVFQEYAHALVLTDSMKGTIQFVLSMTQALVGLSFYRSRIWMYRAWPLLGLGICGLVGMACFGFGASSTAFLAGAAFYGIFSGSLFFYFTFHALTHAATRARNVAGNEIVFGSASLVGPLLGGLLADHVSPAFPYVVFGSVMIPFLIFQAWIHLRDRTITLLALCTSVR